ncbi:MAG: MBL fold metallo-hydrolase [Alphaproteobacteria bacterium]|nr:MBL fold metallo-hydrolase [Alphaproteobacteria bacterium]
MVPRRTFFAALALLAAMPVIVAAAQQALAQARVRPPATDNAEMMENCPGMVASRPPRAVPAAFKLAALAGDQVRITYAGHSTFMLESPQGVKIATDYNDYVKPRALPDIASMNHAHSTHYTDSPDPSIKHVLRGWGPSPEQPARHDIQVSDVRVRNVPTNIRNYMSGGTERHGNSIFIFEIANLCIALLGHLHHTLSQQQLNEIGRIDAVMVPVDGGVTLDHEGMAEVLAALKAPLMIPMHYFSTYSLRGFLNVLSSKSYELEMSEASSVVISKTTLPAKPKVLVLPGRAF